LNIDDKKVPGGAWVTVKYPDIPEVEIGCHVWSYNRKTYDWLEEFFQMNLGVHESQPKIIYKNKFIPYDLKANVLSVKAIIQNSLKFNFEFLKSIRSKPDIRFSLLPAKYKYPIKGAKDIHFNVKRLIEKNQLELLMDNLVEVVKVVKNGGQLILEGGKVVPFCEELVLTSLSRIKRFEFEDGSSYAPTYREVNYIHRHLIIKGNIRKRFSYLRLMNDKVIHRISDMTSQVKGELPDGQLLICVGLFEESYNSMSEREQEDYILSNMKQHKLVSPDATVLNSDSNVFPSFYTPSKAFEEITRRSNSKIRFLRSTDFVYSFYNQLQRYSSLLD